METPALALLALALGARHGLDADHVAAIDGLTRYNADERPRLAAFSGALFALGHGAVVLAVAALGITLGRVAAAPPWLEAAGAWTSIVLLFTLGVLNLRAGWAPGRTPHGPVGLRTRLFGDILRARHPLGVAGVGAAFAVSFDTVSQTLLLVATAATVDATGPGWGGLLAPGLFVLGMVAVDGAGGWWAWRFLRRGGAGAERVARRLSLLVGTVGIAMAALGLARLTVLPEPRWTAAHDLGLSAALLLLPLAAWAAYRWRPPRR